MSPKLCLFFPKLRYKFSSILGSEMQFTCERFALDPCSYGRSLLGTDIQGKKIRGHFALLNAALLICFYTPSKLCLCVCEGGGVILFSRVRPSITFWFLLLILMSNLSESSHSSVVGWCEGAVYLISLGRPTDIGLQLGKACYPCSG